MFKIVLPNVFLNFLPSSTNKLASLHAHHLPEFSETIHQDQVNFLLVRLNDCRERVSVCRFSRNRVEDCSANRHDVANKKMLIYISE